MIYTRFGSPVEIAARCGKHKRKGYRAPLVLVRIHFMDDGTDGYQFAHTLKADGGINEIDAAIDAAPAWTLPKKILEQALKIAE